MGVKRAIAEKPPNLASRSDRHHAPDRRYDGQTMRGGFPMALAIAAVLDLAAFAPACSEGAPVESSGPEGSTTGSSGSAGTGSSSAGSGGEAAGAGGCAPQPVSPMTPPWKEPHPLHQNVCSPSDAAAIANCFVAGQSCDQPVLVTCFQCAKSGLASPYASPLLSDAQGKPAGLNVAGCVGLLAGDGSANGCGPKLEAKVACTSEACAACADEASTKACAGAAATGVCAAQAAAAQCADPYLAECRKGESVLEIAFNLVALFCGP
jgi:hypothetical protein